MIAKMIANSLEKEFNRRAAEGWNIGRWQREMEYLCAVAGMCAFEASASSIQAILYSILLTLKEGNHVVPPEEHGKCQKCRRTIYLVRDHDYWCGDL